MKLTNASSYALQAVTYMAAQKKVDVPIASHTIAEARGIPVRFLLKVLKPLVERGVLVSVKGPNGGYRLARAATDISMLEVIEASDGAIKGSVPKNQKKNEASQELQMKIEEICESASEVVRKHFDKVKLSDLVRH